MPDKATFERWFKDLERRDPKLYEELASRLNERLTSDTQARTLEALALESPADVQPVDIALETIVREGRPALPIKENRITQQDVMIEAAAREIVNRLLAAAAVVEPVIPLVGRIDSPNYPGSAPFLGTGWLVDRNIVVTNRHVAELIARRDGQDFVFRPGRFGDELKVSIDYRRELGSNSTAAAPVLRVIWIEPDPKKADFALLEVGRRGDGTRQEWIELADEDVKPDSDVVVIGYPARAPAHIIPDQAWMDRIYGGTYDVKRIAPGLMGDASRGWATHDCTTLGGNSGSVVVDMKTGKAVALHFAGLYMIENYAVPASTVRQYLKDRPWQSSGPSPGPRPQPETDAGGAPPPAPPPQPRVVPPGNGASVSINIPLTITFTVGQPTVAGGAGTAAGEAREEPRPGGGTSIADAARSLFRERRGEGVLAVRPGYAVERGRLTNRECLVVAAHPERVDAVRTKMPSSYQGFPVDVRPASIADQLAGTAEGIAEEAVTSIAYNDDDRTGEGFSFDWVDEEMTAVLHVGPERSWTVLSDFLARTDRELVSSIYEFHAAHIADAVEAQLADGERLKLVMARQSRDPRNNRIPNGDFDRSETFDRWEDRYGARFDRVFVPVGSGGLVATSYHIKVTVRDRRAIWLSSGNWKRSSQPLISGDPNDPRVTSRAGNREWHVVIENETLANRFRNHILADYERSLELGGELEAIEEQILVDVPMAVLEAVELEAAAARVLEPRVIDRRIRVKPLLTPDQQGRVYGRAVLQLIRSAERQLLFQNQYIGMRGAVEGSSLSELVDALIEKSEEIDDVRIILRSENDNFWDDITELKRRGLDVDRCVRRLGHTHTKGIVADGRRVLVGSHNWSSLGVTLNRDASLIFDDEEAAQYYAEAFELDWERATELTTEEAVVPEAAARLAVGDQPPPGFVRMTLSDFLEG